MTQQELLQSLLAGGHVLDGRYRIVEPIGRGGMANVYRAEDLVLGRPVAIKVFGAEPDSGSHGERKHTEARALGSLSHPALVTVFDAHLDAEPSPYLVMELVEGPSLRHLLMEGPIAEADVVAIAKDLSAAMTVVHGAGIVHRDIKPSNVLLGADEGSRPFRAKLADFGISHLVDGTRLTTTGTLIGTAAYLAPEQLMDSVPAPAADVYALGLVLLECCTGERAFPGTVAESMSARMVSDPVVPATVSEPLRVLLTDMTARDPDERPSAAQVFDAICRIEGTQGDEVVAGATAVADAAVDDASTSTSTATKPMPDVSARSSSRTPTSDPATDAPVGDGHTGDRRRHNRLIALGVSVVLAAALAVGAAMQTAPELEQPALPATDAPLNRHLDQLLDSVTP